MAINLSAEHVGILLPEDVGRLVVQPVDRLSVAAQVSTLVETASPEFRVPIVDNDITATWVAEAAEIGQDSVGTDQLVIVPRKLAALSVISNELAADSSPAAQNVVGMSIARDIARAMDAAFFGSAVGQAPDGLGDLIGFNPVSAGAAWVNLDPFAEAISAADAEGRELTAFCANHADALTLAQLKDDSDTSLRPLLGDPLEGTQRRVLGVPIFVSPAVPAGTVFGLPRDVSMVVRRTGVQLVVDRSRYLEFDSVGIRATMRVGFGWPHPGAIQKISLTA